MPELRQKQNLIDLQDVTKIYSMGEVDVAALNGINLSIYDGELLSIMGPSGSGKSTIMNLIGCLDIPTSGHYFLEEQDVGSLGDNRLAEIRNSKIGFVFQTYNLLPRLTALANVELPMLYGNGRNAKKRALEALDKVGLSDRAGHRPAELSGGQQQRVGIARALAKQPSLILADEPTGNLDSGSAEEIIGILKNLNRDEGITVIVVTHEQEIATQTHRIISMRDGVIINEEGVSPSRGDSE
jgi:putative ABC transport system ATP-binding protein